MQEVVATTNQNFLPRRGFFLGYLAAINVRVGMDINFGFGINALDQTYHRFSSARLILSGSQLRSMVQ